MPEASVNFADDRELRKMCVQFKSVCELRSHLCRTVTKVATPPKEPSKLAIFPQGSFTWFGTVRQGPESGIWLLSIKSHVFEESYIVLPQNLPQSLSLYELEMSQ